MQFFRLTMAKIISTPFIWVLLWIVYFFILGLLSLNSSSINVINVIAPFNTFILIAFIPLSYILACAIVPHTSKKTSLTEDRIANKITTIIYCLATIFILVTSFDQQTIQSLYGPVPAQYFPWLVFYNCSIILVPIALIFRKRVFMYASLIIAIIGLLFNLTLIKPLHPGPFYVISIISLLSFFLFMKSKKWSTFS